MATARTKRVRRSQIVRDALGDGVIALLLTGEFTPGDFEAYLLRADSEALREAWEAARDQLLPAFIKSNPGRRPWGWWEHDSPEPRRRVGGRGTLRNEVFRGWQIVLDHGIPRRAENWINVRDVKVGVRALPLDPANPPTYESEASYLQRLDLLLPGEAKRLRDADSEPGPIMTTTKEV